MQLGQMRTRAARRMNLERLPSSLRESAVRKNGKTPQPTHSDPNPVIKPTRAKRLALIQSKAQQIE